MSSNKGKMPSVFSMAKNFAKDLAKYIKEGAPNVSNQQYVKRLETCMACPHLKKEATPRCGLCGCLVEMKAKWKTTTCPDKPSRWEPVYKDPKTIRDQKAIEQLKKEDEEKLDKLQKMENPHLMTPKERRLYMKGKRKQFTNWVQARGLTSDDLKKASKPLIPRPKKDDNRSRGNKDNTFKKD